MWNALLANNRTQVLCVCVFVVYEVVRCLRGQSADTEWYCIVRDGPSFCLFLKRLLLQYQGRACAGM